MDVGSDTYQVLVFARRGLECNGYIFIDYGEVSTTVTGWKSLGQHYNDLYLFFILKFDGACFEMKIKCLQKSFKLWLGVL